MEGRDRFGVFTCCRLTGLALRETPDSSVGQRDQMEPAGTLNVSLAASEIHYREWQPWSHFPLYIWYKVF